MKYTVYPEVFELDDSICFGIIIGRGLAVTESSKADQEELKMAEAEMRTRVVPEEIRNLPNVAASRTVLTKAGINPNKFTPSVEAMLKRVAKGNDLSVINALVDLCNVISIRHGISLGGHDLKDIHYDLEVRFSRAGDRFLPFGQTSWEDVEPGELVFTAGPEVQTRKWIWRQSELGKITGETRDVFFQLQGFAGNTALELAMSDLKKLVEERFGGSTEVFLVDRETPSIDFAYQG